MSAVVTVLTVSILGLLLILYSIGQVTYDLKGSDNTSIANRWGLTQDLRSFIIIGLGFTMPFAMHSSLQTMHHAYAATSMCFLWSLLNQGFWNVIATTQGKNGWTVLLVIGLPQVIRAYLSATTVLVTLGAVLDRVAKGQLVLIAFFQVIAFHALEHMVTVLLNVTDPGGAITVFLFGALFGTSATAAMSIGNSYVQPAERAILSMRAPWAKHFALLGTAFLTCYWPSFNAATILPVDQQSRAILQTVLAVFISCVAAASTSIFIQRREVLDLLSAAAAGGIAISNVSPVLQFPIYGTMLIGAGSGIISLLMTRFLAPLLHRWDACDVVSRFGAPGLIGGLMGVIVNGAMVRNGKWPFLLAAIGVSIGTALLGGLLAGAIVRLLPISRRPETEQVLGMATTGDVDALSTEPVIDDDDEHANAAASRAWVRRGVGYENRATAPDSDNESKMVALECYIMAVRAHPPNATAWWRCGLAMGTTPVTAVLLPDAADSIFNVEPAEGDKQDVVVKSKTRPTTRLECFENAVSLRLNSTSRREWEREVPFLWMFVALLLPHDRSAKIRAPGSITAFTRRQCLGSALKCGLPFTGRNILVAALLAGRLDVLDCADGTKISRNAAFAFPDFSIDTFTAQLLKFNISVPTLSLWCHELLANDAADALALTVLYQLERDTSPSAAAARLSDAAKAQGGLSEPKNLGNYLWSRLCRFVHTNPQRNLPTETECHTGLLRCDENDVSSWKLVSDAIDFHTSPNTVQPGVISVAQLSKQIALEHQLSLDATLTDCWDELTICLELKANDSVIPTAQIGRNTLTAPECFVMVWRTLTKVNLPGVTTAQLIERHDWQELGCVLADLDFQLSCDAVRRRERHAKVVGQEYCQVWQGELLSARNTSNSSFDAPPFVMVSVGLEALTAIHCIDRLLQVPTGKSVAQVQPRLFAAAVALLGDYHLDTMSQKNQAEFEYRQSVARQVAHSPMIVDAMISKCYPNGPAPPNMREAIRELLKSGRASESSSALVTQFEVALCLANRGSCAPEPVLGMSMDQFFEDIRAAPNTAIEHLRARAIHRVIVAFANASEILPASLAVCWYVLYLTWPEEHGHTANLRETYSSTLCATFQPCLVPATDAAINSLVCLVQAATCLETLPASVPTDRQLSVAVWVGLAESVVKHITAVDEAAGNRFVVIADQTFSRLQLCQKALDADPASPFAWLALGIAIEDDDDYKATGATVTISGSPRFVTAEECFKHATKDPRTESDAWYRLGALLSRMDHDKDE